MIALYLVLVFIGAYLIGNINFARIFSKAFSRRDITEIGSKNPGTMNMLRTHGFAPAILTLIFEAIKSGLPAIATYFLFLYFYPEPGFANLAYFISAIGGVVGHCFPVFYKFKGGKGVACAFGMFLFHPACWWVSLITFVVCFLLFMVIEYPFIISIIFLLTLSIYSTCIFHFAQIYFALAVILVVWFGFALILFMHRGNIKRLIQGKENKVNFREKLFKKKEKHQVAELSTANVEAEKELPVNDEKQTENQSVDN